MLLVNNRRVDKDPSVADPATPICSLDEQLNIDANPKKSSVRSFEPCSIKYKAQFQLPFSQSFSQITEKLKLDFLSSAMASSQASLLLQKQLKGTRETRESSSPFEFLVFSVIEFDLIVIFSDLCKHPVDGFSAGLVDEKNIFEWSVTIIGPPDTL